MRPLPVGVRGRSEASRVLLEEGLENITLPCVFKLLDFRRRRCVQRIEAGVQCR